MSRYCGTSGKIARIRVNKDVMLQGKIFKLVIVRVRKNDMLLGKWLY